VIGLGLEHAFGEVAAGLVLVLLDQLELFLDPRALARSFRVDQVLFETGFRALVGVM
jgi:hypothetical protein